MHDDALKQLWQQQAIELPPMPDQRQLAAIKARMHGFDQRIRRRDWVEVLVCIFCAFFFGYDLVFRGPSSWLSQLGDVVLVVSSLFIAWRLVWTKARLPKAEPNAPVLESVRIELLKVENQIRLLSSILWWYLLPIFAGVQMSFWGSGASLPAKLSYLAAVVLVYAFIYWLNQRAVRKNLLPLKRELESLLEWDNSSVPPKPAGEGKKNIMTKLMLAGAVLLLLLAGIAIIVTRESPAPPVAYTDPVAQILEGIRVKHGLPALAAAVVLDGRIVSTNAVGVRKWGGPEQVTVDDKFHIGAVTKSMTATVAGMLVEQGKISWETTIGEVFADLRNQIDTNYHAVTLEQLLSHQSGAPRRPPAQLWSEAWEAKGSPAEQRLEFTKGILAEKPEATPGTEAIYSNQGYAIAGVMLEKASGRTWEELMQSLLFEPLQMATAGFGAPASIGQVDQPWGHRVGVPSPRPESPGPRADNPLAISPSGAVHCSIADLAKYAAFHLSGERGQGKLLQPQTFGKLHTPVADNYALGWMTIPRRWAGGEALWHNGGNTMFYAVLWIAPQRNFAVAVATNSGDPEKATEGCNEVVTQLIERFLGR